MKKTTQATMGAAVITGAAVAAAYYLYGSDKAKAHRTKLAAWAKSAEKEIVQKAKQLKKVALTDETMKAVIAEVAQRYEQTKKLDPKDVRAFIGSMQKEWKEARKSMNSKSVKSTVKKATSKAKSAVKKVVKKVKKA